MADKKILDLTAKTTPTDTDAVIVQESGGASGSTKYAVLSGLWTWIKTKSDVLYAAASHAHGGTYDPAGTATAQRASHESAFSHGDIAANTAARHTHGNLTLLDTYTQAEADLADAVAKRHAHDNLTALDLVSGTNTGDEATFTGPGLEGLVPDPISATGRYLGDAGAWSVVTVGTDQITDGAVTSSKLGDGLQRRHIAISTFDAAGSVVVGDGVIGVPVPAELDGWVLVDALCGVATAGTTGTMDVQIRRRRAGANADMLGTKLTVASGAYTADNGVIDPANDDLATGDLIYIDFDAVHTTPAKGAAVVLTLEKP